MREPTYIQEICCKCASKNFVQMKTWNDKISIRFQIILSGTAVDSIKEKIVLLGRKINSSCYSALGVCERGKEEMERQIFSWINVEDIPYPNDSSKRNLNSYASKQKLSLWKFHGI